MNYISSDRKLLKFALFVFLSRRSFFVCLIDSKKAVKVRSKKEGRNKNHKKLFAHLIKKYGIFECVNNNNNTVG
jgi:hypothetical protein